MTGNNNPQFFYIESQTISTCLKISILLSEFIAQLMMQLAKKAQPLPNLLEKWREKERDREDPFNETTSNNHISFIVIYFFDSLIHHGYLKNIETETANRTSIAINYQQNTNLRMQTSLQLYAKITKMLNDHHI